MESYNLVSFCGIFILILFGWICSSHRRQINWKTIAAGVLIQLIFGALIFWMPGGTKFFLILNDLVTVILNASQEGARFCFGLLAVPPGAKESLGFILVFQALPSVIFVAALMEILYFLKIMPFFIGQFGRFFTRWLGVSGAESLCTASNIFVGVESATTILPYLRKMTRSELCTVLTAGMATIASSMLGVYVMLLRDHFPQIAGHLISASLLSAPAAIVMSKLLLPETGHPETLGRAVKPAVEKSPSLMAAAVKGANAGGKMVVGIVILLIAFLGLMALVNLALPIRLEELLKYLFYPFALIIGIPQADAFEAARLLGERLVLTEVIAYQHLDILISGNLLHHPRSAVLISYALCGFAHIASVAIFVGGTAALAPERTEDLTKVAFRALLAATLACLMTACIAGTFFGRGNLLQF